VATEPTWATDVSAFARRTMADHQIPGLAVAVAQQGTSVYTEGFGHRDVEKDVPITPGTVFGIASTTKSFTCLAIMLLVEAGKLSVEDPVIRYLPEFRTPDPEATQRIMIHHFMTHSSGLPPLPSRFFVFKRSAEGDPAAEKRPSWVADHDPIETHEELMAYIAGRDFTLLGPPGAQFSYSNEGFALLGAIVERVSGQSFDQFVQEHILDPAGMTHSTFDLARLRQFPDVTTLYARSQNDGDEKVYAANTWLDAPMWSAAGRLNTNVHDMLRYLEIYRTGGMVGSERIASAETVQRMMTPHVRTAEPNRWYGYGFSVTPDYHGVSVVGHGGGRKGISAHVSIARDVGFTSVVLANLQGVPVAPILLAALNTTLGLPVDAPATAYGDYARPPKHLARYTGDYRSGEGGPIRVTIRDGALVFGMAEKEFTARPVGEHAFVMKQKNGEAYSRFLMRPTGEAYAVTSGSRIIQRVPIAQEIAG